MTKISPEQKRQLELAKTQKNTVLEENIALKARVKELEEINTVLQEQVFTLSTTVETTSTEEVTSAEKDSISDEPVEASMVKTKETAKLKFK